MDNDRGDPAEHPGPRDLDLMRLYLDELGWHALLSRADEVRLARAIEEGARAALELGTSERLGQGRRRTLEDAVAAGERARKEFIRSNLRLVVSIAK
ncbi:MAG TPA: sigma-70 factor domain-containing protein, partial [Acidimicrobiales bacterium]|nr:sigma-70 factor domain-containing protein [Acidimicrobiales bacterium]